MEDHVILKNHFSKTFVLAGAPQKKGWSSQQALDTGACIDFLLTEIDAAFARNTKSADDVFAIASAIRGDALATKKIAPTHAARDVCDFIILYACTPAIETGIGTGRMGPAYDALTQSISDKPGALVQELDAARVIKIGKLSQLYGTDIAELLLQWYYCLFYVARVRSTLGWLCEAVLSSARSLVRAHLSGRTFEVAVDCLVSMGDWAAHAKPALAPELAAEIDDLYSNGSTPANLRAKTGFALTTALGSYTATSVLDRAKEVLAQWKSHLRAHEPLQLLAMTAIQQCDAAKLQEVIDEAESHAAQMRTITSERAYLRYGGERLFEILTPALSRLIEESRTDDLCKLLQAWYGIDAPRRNGRIVFINCREQHAHWFGATKSIVVTTKEAAQTLLVAFADALNDFAGTTVTVANKEDLEIKAPARFGFPEEAKSPAFLASITDLYGLDAEELRAPFPADHALRPIPHWTSSIQIALLMTAGWTLPIAASLQEPAPNRQVRRAVFWGSGTLVEGFELNAIRASFAAAGIHLDVVQGADCTRDRFIQLYASPDYDLFWVTSHCEYDHFDPHRTFLKLDSTGSATLSMLELEGVAIPTEGRRLLVLNVCDGATAAVLRGALG